MCQVLNVEPDCHTARIDVISLLDGAAEELEKTRKLPGGIMHLIEQLDLRVYLGPTYAEDPTKVIDSRFMNEVAVHNHRQICKFAAPIPTEKLASEEVRKQRVEQYGYWLLHGFRVLTHIGFWRAFGLDDADHASSLTANAFNILNGGAEVDYEAKFPEAKEAFDRIAHHKFHIDPATYQGRSALSVPDIILGVILTRAVASLPSELRDTAIRTSAAILDTRITNAERIELYAFLETIWSKSNGSVQQLQGLVSTMSDSGLAAVTGNPFPWTLEHGTDWSPDVIIPLHGGDCEGAAYAARSILLPKHPMAFITPVGSQAPHQAKSLGVDTPSFSEAQAMVAALLEKDCADRFGSYPDSPPRAPSRPVRTYDILPSTPASMDTIGNVKEAAIVLEALRKEYGRPLNVLLVTSRHHSQRAAVEFSTGLPKELASVRYWLQPTPAVMERVGHAFKPVGIGNAFCEFVKRLYAIVVA